MVFSSQKETHDSNIPSNTSSRISTHQRSISNFSVHTTSTIRDEDLFGHSESGQGPDRDFPIPDHKSSHSLEKPTDHGLRNQSLSTIYTVREPESDHSSIETSTPNQELCSLSLPTLPSTLFSSAIIPFTVPSPSSSSNYGVTLSTDHLTELYGDSQPSATVEILKADKAPTLSTPFLSTSTDSLSTTSLPPSGTATVKGKKGVLGFMTDFLNSNKRLKISTPYDPVHLVHVGINSSTGEFIGLPKEWQQLLQDSGNSKSDQEKNSLTVMEIDKVYLEGGGDMTGLASAQGSSRRPLIPGAANAAHPGAPASVNAATRESPNSSNTDVGQASKASIGPVVEPRDHQLVTTVQQQSTTVTSSAKTADAISRRRKKKEGKTNDADIIKWLQHICTDADPTRLYRSLVKIGQG